MKRRRIIAFVIALSTCTTLLTGCGHAKTGNATIDKMSTDELGTTLVRALKDRSDFKAANEELQGQVDELNQKVQGVQYADPEFPAITKVDDDTGRTTFKKPGDYVKLPDPMRVPGDTPAEVNNVISMGGEQGIKMKMAPVWSYRIEGNKLWVSSSTGVYGVIVLGKMNSDVNMTLLNTLFDGSPGQAEVKDQWNRIVTPYIEKSEGLKKSIPADPGKGAGKDGAISWNTKQVGRQVELNTSVEGKSAVFRAGALAVQTNSVMYSFMYDSAYDDAKEAIILALIQSIVIQNINLAVEF